MKGFTMLVLSRKKDEAILIKVPGYPIIKVAVVRIGPNNCRLGIDADRSISVIREELQSDPSQPEASPVV
jgi:carbon storage regulator CsrA